jgi:hypothetical protein
MAHPKWLIAISFNLHRLQLTERCLSAYYARAYCHGANYFSGVGLRKERKYAYIRQAYVKLRLVRILDNRLGCLYTIVKRLGIREVKQGRRVWMNMSS